MYGIYEMKLMAQLNDELVMLKDRVEKLEKIIADQKAKELKERKEN